MEKEAIERATAEGFLSLYNKHVDSDFKISSTGTPDVQCKNSKGKILNIEATSAQDQPGDIQALLGRSNHKNIDNLDVENTDAPNFVSFEEDVYSAMAETINAKITKRYGSNTALVVRDTSGCDWEWDTITQKLLKMLKKPNPFDKGIWILSRDKSKCYLIE
jgi:hypothetical protein